ncbi:MAG: DUF4231 domain-containing protein [Peptococcaceae bacterium]|nr:DUF4231 domain-containing protein [Peptococcaceae bacterium]
MTEEQYITERLDNQIEWYDKKSTWNQYWFKRLKTLELLLSASIPAAIGYVAEQPWLKIYIAMAGATIAIITGIHGLYNFQENWIQYRATCEMLKHEKYMFLAGSGIYTDTQDTFCLLVDRVENIISHENINWTQIQRCYPKSQAPTCIGGSSKSTGS